MRYTKAVSGKGGKYLVDLLDIQVVADKLGQLEDIEEELGIDLIKLLSAKEIYTYQYNEPIKDFCIDFNKKTISDYYEADINSTYSFDDYGKYWAFTKEELK
jgi:hypothetical protein